MSDLDLLRRLGDQIVPPSFEEIRGTARRRTLRTATVATVAAGAAVAVAVGAVQLGVIHHQTPPTEQQQNGIRPLTYGDGANVHYGDQTVTMPRGVVELDVTDNGVVVRTDDDRIWFTDGSDPEQIGAVGESAWGDVLWNHYVGRVVSGNSGSEVAWFEFPQPRSPHVVVYDTDPGHVVARYPVEMPSGTVGGLYSVDAESVYGFTDLTYGEDLSPNWRIDLATGTQSTQSSEQYQAILQHRSAARSLQVSHNEAATPASFVPFDGLQEFSVKGTHVVPEGEQPLFVLDGLTDKGFRFSAPPEYPETIPVWLVQWLDDDSVVLQADQGDRIDLLECQVSTGACEVALEAPSDAVVPELAAPNSSTKSSD